MSTRFLSDYCEYFEKSTNVAPTTLPGLASELHRTQLRILPVDTLYEPLACPVQGFSGPDDLFAVPNEDSFFVDLLGPEDAQDVLCARELRDRIADLVDRPSVRLWLVTDAYTHACRSALYMERCDPDNAYRVNALFVSERDLEEGTVIEVLLLAALSLADKRLAELRVAYTSTPFVRFCYAVLGFLRVGEQDLVRQPMADLVGSAETLRVVEGQLTGQWATHCATRLSPPQ